VRRIPQVNSIVGMGVSDEGDETPKVVDVERQ
jgi:hypothetical protein